MNEIRAAQFDSANRGDAKARTAPVTLATTAAVDRGRYLEILDLRPEAVDLSRAVHGLPLIESHDRTQVNIGVVRDIVADGTRLRGVAYFGNSRRAQELYADIADGIVTGASLGYGYLDDGEPITTPDGPARRFKIQPFELSVVSVPADVRSGFNRQGVISMSDSPAAPTGAPDRLRETAEAQRTRQILDLAASYERHLKPQDAADAIRNGKSCEWFKELILTRMETREAAQITTLDWSPREAQRYSLGRAIVAAITNDWSQAGFEREASRALEKQTGLVATGFLVPASYWAAAGRRDFNVGTATEAGNLVATDLRGDLFVDVLRAQLIASALGMRILSGLTSNIAIPRKSTASTLGTLTEIGSASETAPAIAQVSLTPKRVGAYVEFSKQALLQSSVALEPMLRDDLVQGAARLIENLVINGNGTAPQYTGLRYTTGMGTSTAGANGAAPAWSHIVGLETLAAASNAEATNSAGYLTNPKVRGLLKQTQKGTSLEMCWPDALPVGGLARLNGYPVAVSGAVPANLTKGTSTTVCSAALFSSDWSMAVLGLFGAPDVTVDPYTLAATGQVRITLNQFADFGVRQPAAFVKIEDLITG